MLLPCRTPQKSAVFPGASPAAGRLNRALFSWLHTQIWSCTCWTRVPLSLPTAWRQPLKTHKNLEWVTEGRMSRRTYDLHSLHWYHLGHSFGKALPPPPPLSPRQRPSGFFQDCLLGTPGIYFRHYRLQWVQGILIPRACENWLECVNQSLHSPMTPPTASLQLWNPPQFRLLLFSPVTGKRMCFLQTSECPILSLQIQIKVFIHLLFLSHKYPGTWFLPSP